MAEYIERERWKVVPDFGGKYRVSNFGRIMNEKGILLSPFLTQPYKRAVRGFQHTENIILGIMTVKGGQTMIELLARVCIGLAFFVILVITITIICNKERRDKSESNSVNE